MLRAPADATRISQSRDPRERQVRHPKQQAPPSCRQKLLEFAGLWPPW